MKKLLLFFFLLVLTDLKAAISQLSLWPAEVNADTLDFQFSYSGNFIFKGRSARTWLMNSGKDTIHIDRVVQYSDDGVKFHLRRNKVIAFPEYCAPGISYEVFFEVQYPKSTRFVLYTTQNDSVEFRVFSSGRVPVFLAERKVSSQATIQGELSHSKLIIRNDSPDWQIIDSFAVPGGKWSCSTPFPFTLKPGDSATLAVHTRFQEHNSVYASGRVNVFHHSKRTAQRDMSSCYVAVHFTHGGVIVGAQTRDFGLVKNGDTLRTTVTVKNQGETVLLLKESAALGVESVSKDTLFPGDTATLHVCWKVRFAEGNFLFNQPLFNDYGNGKCTFTFKGTTDKKDNRPYHFVNVDSLIWIETSSYDFGELSSSQGRVERAFKCRNNSPVPVIITNCVTGDGGSMAWSTREPIQPGQEFTITFLQDLKGGRVQFNRTVTATIQVGEITVQKRINCRGVIVND